MNRRDFLKGLAALPVAAGAIALLPKPSKLEALRGKLEARTERASDRKIVTRARIEAGDELTAQAEGLFIIPKNFTGNLPRLAND